MVLSTMASTNQIVANLIRTPDGTILQSFSRHDYKEHVDANGETYMVDGGLDYLRRSIGQKEVYEELSVYDDDPTELIRKHFKWGTYGKNGDQPLKYVPLESMSTAHIQACIDNLILHPLHKKLFENELAYRKEKGIVSYE